MEEPAAYDTFAAFYDGSDLDRRAEVAFYLSLLRKSDRAFLELACGTGTITIPLANDIIGRHGVAARIVGVDASARTRAVARGKIPELEWLRGDMRDPPVQGGFDLVICAFNTLQLIVGDEDLMRTFRAVQALLNPDGLFAFDIYQPNLDYLNSLPPDNSRAPERLNRSFFDEQGRALQIWESRHYDSAAFILTDRWCVRDGQDATAAPVTYLEHRMRQYSANEIETILNASGLIVRERFGDVNRSTFSPVSKKQVIVCGPSR